MKQKVLFPLRSNLDWFRRPDLSLDLESRIKISLLLFDELVFEDGKYSLTVFRNGSTDFYTPPDQLKDSIRYSKYSSEGQQGSIGIKSNSGSVHQLAGGKILFQANVDFKPILEASNLIKLPFIELIEIDNSKKIKDLSKRVDTSFFKKPTRKNRYFEYGSLSKNFSYASSQSFFANAPFVVSQSFNKILKKRLNSSSQHAPDSLMRSLLEFVLPNFGELPWDEVIDLRQERALVGLRKKLKDLRTSANPQLEMKDQIIESLLLDVNKLKPSRLDKVFSVGLDLVGFVPNAVGLLAGGIDLAKDIFGVSKEVSSWSAILLTLRKYSDR